MILRKNEINLQFIGTQLIDDCPLDASAAFQNGFLDFLQAFFQNLDCCSAPFGNPDGSYDVDMNVVLDFTFDWVEDTASKQPLDQVQEFWLGVMAAVPLADKKIKFAFECPCESEAA